MEKTPLLPLPEGMVIEEIQITETGLVIEVVATSLTSYCPLCSHPSSSLHCHYQRTVRDVPCAGRSVQLLLTVRKFSCRNPDCSRKVFAERLPDLVKPWARCSSRLLEELKAIGLSASAEVSERLAPQLGMQVKAPTLLRYLRTIPDPPRTDVTSLGLDDFALRRGDTYGTILVNAETGKPLDLLPDRTAEAVIPWLALHPEIQVVSRDRASGFADAVSRALPHATQVADRYHLLQNLREHLQRVFDRKRTCLPLIEDTPVQKDQANHAGTADQVSNQQEGEIGGDDLKHPEKTAGQASEQEQDLLKMQIDQQAELACLTYAERKKKISRDKRVARYEEIQTLHQEGMSQRAIARALHLSRKTVKLFVSASMFPERAEGTGLRALGKSKLDRYLPYLRERWEAGAHKGSQLFGEIKERGYTGSASLLNKLLFQWRAELPPKRRQGSPPKQRIFARKGQRRLSSRAASFLMILPKDQMTTKEQQQIKHICQADADLCTLYLLSQEFVALLKERRAQALDNWLQRAKESHISELTSFARGISRDYAAVYAACSRPESNGVTEGHVNRLKFLKRQMFGRAHLDLLRIKVLHAV
jgi:transposase